MSETETAGIAAGSPCGEAAVCTRTGAPASAETCAAAFWEALNGPKVVWSAKRVETYGDYVSNDSIGIFSTREKAMAACVRYADGDPLVWVDRLPNAENSDWWESEEWANPRDPRSEYRFDVHSYRLDRFPFDPE